MRVFAASPNGGSPTSSRGSAAGLRSARCAAADPVAARAGRAARRPAPLARQRPAAGLPRQPVRPLRAARVRAPRRRSRIPRPPARTPHDRPVVEAGRRVDGAARRLARGVPVLVARVRPGVPAAGRPGAAGVFGPAAGVQEVRFAAGRGVRGHVGGVRGSGGRGAAQVLLHVELGGLHRPLPILPPLRHALPRLLCLVLGRHRRLPDHGLSARPLGGVDQHRRGGRGQLHVAAGLRDHDVVRRRLRARIRVRHILRVDRGLLPRRRRYAPGRGLAVAQDVVAEVRTDQGGQARRRIRHAAAGAARHFRCRRSCWTRTGRGVKREAAASPCAIRRTGTGLGTGCEYLDR